ncbi:MAG: spherulation-specific family 4 protein [Planctomycetota bacterium]
MLTSVAGIFLAAWPAGGALAVEIVVPAYFYPSSSGSDWDRLNVAAAVTPTTAIMNPFNGPGGSLDPNYTRAVDDFRAAGGRVLGYVASGFGGRPLAEVTADIDAYDAWYDIDGIFIDEMSNAGIGSVIDFYESIYNHTKSVDSGWELMGNPGINTNESYLTRPTADRLMVFESFGNLYPGHRPSAWNANYDSSVFVNLLHTLPSGSTAADYVDIAVQRNVGGVYFTDDVLNNPWDRLPTYWDQFVAKVVAVNDSIGPIEVLSNPVAAGTIAIDASRDDWSSPVAYAADTDSVAPGPEVDWATATVANDNDHLYLRLTAEAGSTATALGSTHRVYLDTDNDRDTGFVGGADEFAVGADYLILGDSLFAFQGATQQTFSWDFLQSVDADDSIVGDIELAAPLAALGDPDSLSFFLQANNSATDDVLPNAAVGGPLGAYFSYEVGVAPVVGDFDGDGDVDSADYDTWVTDFGSTTVLRSDANEDGLVNAADYTIWRDAFALAASSAAVPEPNAALLLAAAIGTCSPRRRFHG